MKITEPQSKTEFGIPDGEYTVSISSCEFLENEIGEPSDNLRIILRVENGEYKGQQTSIFCPLDRQFGKVLLAKIAGYSHAAEKLEKKRNLKTDLTPEQWASTYIDLQDDKKNKLTMELLTLLPGHYLWVELKTREYKDKEGNLKTAQRVTALGFANQSKVPTATQNKTEEEDW